MKSAASGSKLSLCWVLNPKVMVGRSGPTLTRLQRLAHPITCVTNGLQQGVEEPGEADSAISEKVTTENRLARLQAMHGEALEVPITFPFSNARR